MSRESPGRGRLALLAPALWLAAFVLAPFAIVAKISLSETAFAQPPYRPAMPWSLDAESWRAFLSGLGLDNYRSLLAEPLYRDAAFSSLGFAAVATVLIGLIGYPVSLALARAPRRWRPLLLALVIVPFWTSFLIRVYAWIAILKDDGWLNAVLLGLGLVATPLRILNTDAAVLVGLVYTYLPFLILPVYAALDRQDPTLAEAAADLGASPPTVFWTVVFPISLPGLTAGALLCFIPIVGEFVVPDLLGGPDTLTLGRTLWSEFFSNRDWPLASAVAVVTLVILIVPVLAFREVEARRLEAGR